MFRKNHFDLPVKKVEKRENELIITEEDFDPNQLTMPFPQMDAFTEADKNAVLSYSACDFAMSCMNDLTKILLQGKA